MGVTPSAVTGISCTSTFDGMSIFLHWLPSGMVGADDGISGYYIYRSALAIDSPTDYFSKLNSSIWTGITYFDKPVVPPEGHGQYWYKVSASNAFGEGDKSGPYSVYDYNVFDLVPIFSQTLDDLII